MPIAGHVRRRANRHRVRSCLRKSWTRGEPRAPRQFGRAARQLCFPRSSSRYTTLLRAVELWGAVQADGPGRLAGDEEPPAVDGFVVCRKQDLSQQIKANPEDRLSTAFVGLNHV